MTHLGLFLRTQVALSLGGLSLGTVAVAKPPTMLPGLQRDGSMLLPNQWSLRPVGHQIVVGDFPTNLAIHPSAAYAAVLHCGYSQHEVRIIDLRDRRVISTVPLSESFYGLAWSPDGSKLYCSGAGSEVIHVFSFAQGYLSAHKEWPLRAAAEIGVPIGIAPTPDGRALYVAEGWGQRVDKLDSTTGKAIWSHALGSPLDSTWTDPEGERLKPTESADAPYPYACLPDRRHDRVYVSLWGKSTVLVLNAKDGAEVTRWEVGQHPNELALSNDGRLFVAEANFNTISILNVETGKRSETLFAALTPDAFPGSMPNSLALSADGRTLFVANANNNDIAVFDVSKIRHAVSLGFIPVGWFPTSVRLTPDGRHLLVANGKGMTSAPNPAGPSPGDTRPMDLQEYIGALFKGTVSVIDLPALADRAAIFGQWTKAALATTPRRSIIGREENNPIPAAPGPASPIKHVIYIVKENRTYDQILGDLPKGNGDARLCLFGDKVTPNLHALARQFVLLDNFYVDGEVSADGHEWTMGAYASDFVEKTWPLNYGHRDNKIAYPSEGAFQIATPAGGYLWDQAARRGVSYRSYGEFVSNGRKPEDPSTPRLPVLKDHIDPRYRGFDLTYPDVKRTERFVSELTRYEAEGEMPRLQVVRLGNDHTEGSKVGARTPTALVADNDLAVGKLVEAVSHSKFWATTAIFVLEDDAQNGPDHVDAHRSPAFVVSPYTKRQAVDSSMYSTSSMLRTIELILGLPPMSQFDAQAAPMFAVFTGEPDLTPFTAQPAQVNLEERNTETAWGTRQSQRMNFEEADRADDIVLNEIVWRSVKGPNSVMPAPVRAAFFKRVMKGDKDDD